VEKPDRPPKVDALINEIQRYRGLVEALRADERNRPPASGPRKPPKRRS
jgi:hypothetical protein